MTTLSEELFERYCRENDIPCERVPCASGRTPDYRISLGDVVVVCEVKQIDPNPEDQKELQALVGSGRTAGARWIRNRVAPKLKDISGQLREARDSGLPTLVVLYDNTPFRCALDHDDVLIGMFGEVTLQEVIGPAGETLASRQYFGKNRRVGPGCNTSISAIGVLRAGPDDSLMLHVYHNRFAAQPLDPTLLDGCSCKTRLHPDDDEVNPWD